MDTKSDGMKKISKDLARQKKEKINLQEKLRKSESDKEGLRKVQADLISSLYSLQKQIEEKDNTINSLKGLKEGVANEERNTNKVDVKANQAKELVSKTINDKKTKTRK